MHARMRDVLAKKERALFARKNNKKKIDGSDEPLRYSGRPVISSRPGERAREGRKVDEDLEGRRGRKMMVGKTGRAFDLPAEDRLDDIKKGVREPLRELVEGNTTNKTKIFVCQLKAVLLRSPFAPAGAKNFARPGVAEGDSVELGSSCWPDGAEAVL
jgi:hypothetical protein